MSGYKWFVSQRKWHERQLLAWLDVAREWWGDSRLNAQERAAIRAKILWHLEQRGWFMRHKP